MQDPVHLAKPATLCYIKLIEGLFEKMPAAVSQIISCHIQNKTIRRFNRISLFLINEVDLKLFQSTVWVKLEAQVVQIASHCAIEIFQSSQ